MRSVSIVILALAANSVSATSPYDAAYAEAVNACQSPAVFMHNQAYYAWPAERSYLPVQSLSAASLPFANADGIEYLQQKIALFSQGVSHSHHIDHSCEHQLLANASAMFARGP